MQAQSVQLTRKDKPTVASSTARATEPLQTLNSSLKRIRLQETGHGPRASITDSFEQEWGTIDLTELDDEDLTLSSKKTRKEEVIDLTELDDWDTAPDAGSSGSKEAHEEEGFPELDDTEDFDGFMLPEVHTIISGTTEEERQVLAEKFPADDNRTTFKSVSAAAAAIAAAVVVTQHSHLSAPTKPKLPKRTKITRSSNNMEDVFSEEQVRNWSEVRIKTWEHRKTNTEAFYYRFVDPAEGQQNGPWSLKSEKEFMARYEEWKARGIRIGSSWGIFSMSVSHKAGYQCSSHYRRLLEKKKLTDPAYIWEGGKLVMVNKSIGGELANSGLSELWDTDEVKAIEANVNRWIKEYHTKPARPSKRIDVSKRIDMSGSSRTGCSQPGIVIFKPTTEAPRVKATTASVVPTGLSIRSIKQQLTDEGDLIPVVNIHEKLAEYSSFMRKSSSIASDEPDQISRTIPLTVPGTVKPSSMPPARAFVPIEVKKAPLTNNLIRGQTGLALFWKNIRPVRVECPDIPKGNIPKDVDLRPTWAHKIQPFVELNAAPVEGSIYKEVRKMIGFNWKALSEGFEEPVNDIQSIIADPPWAFIVEDGRNDGACKLTPNEFGEIIGKALELMPSGIVSVWTHKAILPEVVNIMHGLGCRYVENLVWYKMALNNTNLDRASPYFRTSKEILLMFKKGDGFDIRHQRSADVIMDFEMPTSSWIKEDYTEPKPESVYEMMETMLPNARYMPEKGRGRFLEIWAKRCQERRPGWFSVHELKPSAVEVGWTLDDDLEGIDEVVLAQIVNDMDME
ncbi:hypothetical protein BGZ65_007392, partial [Modicella reniformis]